MALARPAGAEQGDYNTVTDVDTLSDAIRVTVVRAGGVERVSAGGSGSSAGSRPCTYSLVWDPSLDDTPYGTSAGPQPSPDARFALLLCDGVTVRAVWVQPRDVVDVDAMARQQAQRYVEDVLAPAISVGANPDARGLVGLPSWFWVSGVAATTTPPPISALGLSIELRLTSGSVTWDFGDETVVDGDLGQAYPAESSVQHAHQQPGTHRVTARVQLEVEYRVDGGPWLAAGPLTVTAAADRDVEERQAVVTAA